MKAPHNGIARIPQLVLITLLVVAVAACGGGGGGGGSALPVPVTPQAVSMDISPQGSFLSAGNTEQLSASATLSDGSTKTLQPSAWKSSDTSLADVSAGGVVSAHAAGSVTITGTEQGLSATTTITIQPAFTTRTYQSGSLLILENTAGQDIVRIGMDLTLGGAVAEFSLNGSDAVAKAANGSHLIAIGLVDADGKYDTAADYGWNPIESCDVYRHGGPILAQSVTSDTVYIKSNAVETVPDNKGGGPTQPALSDIIIERWFSPVANHPYAFQERYKLTHTGNDRHAGAINAVPSFEISAILFDRMVYYSGTSPGVAATPTTLLGSDMPQWPQTTHPGRLWLSERWGAIANQQGFGVLDYNPQAFPYAGPAIANVDPTNQSLGFSIDTPFTFLPGSTVQFDTFLMVGNVATMQRETYDIKRRLGPFADISPPMGNLDLPADGSTVTGTVTVTGWAFDSDSDTTTELYIDDVLVARGAVNMPSPGFDAVYPGSPTNVIYQFDLDTTQLANGSHTIEVRASDAAGNVALLPHHAITVKN